MFVNLVSNRTSPQTWDRKKKRRPAALHYQSSRTCLPTSCAERLQAEAQHRVEEVKQQAKKPAVETRKAAETAAWCLFGTAVVSAGASAIAGALAVIR